MSMQQGPFSSPSCPTEILSRIFECCIDWPLQLHEPSLGLPPSLTATCQRWREVAFSYPRLWSSINVDFNEGGAREPRSLLTKQQHSEKLVLLQTWLARSKSAPLQFGISGSQVSRADQVDFMAYLGCMLLHADHCSKIEIVLIGDIGSSLSSPANYRNSPGAQRRNLAIPRDFSLTPLEQVDLYWDSYFDCSAFEHAFEFAPNLRIVRLDAPHLTRWCFPWSQLTTLCIGEIIDDERPIPLDIPWLLVTLSRCVSLEFLAIASQDIWPCMPLPSAERVVLNRVREAHFDSWDVNVLDILLRVISVPSVQKLSFHEITLESLPSAGESFMDYISNHAATLRELLTNRIGISSQNLLRCYRSAANLSHIHLIGLLRTLNSSEILRGLVLRFRDDGTLLEGQNIQLQRLTLHFGVPDDPENPSAYLPTYGIVNRMEDLVEPLLDIIRSRWKSPSTSAGRSDGSIPIAVLDTLDIEGDALEWMKKVDPERYGYLMKAVDEGLTLVDEVMGRGVWPDLPQ